MKSLGFVLGKSSRPRNLSRRILTILTRFGLTSRKIETQLELLLRVTDRNGVRPTMAVTAVTARRHPAVLAYLAARGVEVAAHGYAHGDYSTVPAWKQTRHARRARVELERIGLQVKGWRSPYSKWNANLLDALRSAGFSYDATPVVAWHVYRGEGVDVGSESASRYAKLDAQVNVSNGADRMSLPTVVDGLVQIPVSVPQDEDMVDRLQLDVEAMTKVWHGILHETHRRGELFVICIHPEHVSVCHRQLESTLIEAKRLGDVWTPTLGELANWWLQRDHVHVGVKSVGEGLWHVTISGPAEIVTTCNGRTISGPRAMVSAGPKSPTIYCGHSWPGQVRQRLRDVGYVVDQHPEDAGLCVLNLSDVLPTNASPEAAVGIAKKIDTQLIRVLPWPVGYQSCLSVSSDIAALTLLDFAMQIKEF